MNPLVAKHADAVIGTLSGFDRLVFTGTLRQLAYTAGLKLWLWAAKVLLKDFAAFAEGMTWMLKQASEAEALRTGRPIHYLSSSAASKEDIARGIARKDGIETGLICILTAVEPCWSFEIRRDRDAKRLFLEPAQRKCLFLYHYMIHPIFGFMHARIQTWAPFRIQICLNPHRPPDQRSRVQQRNTPWANLISSSLLLKRFDVVWNRNPALGTLHPDEGAWAEPTRFIKRAGFDGSHVRCGLQNVIDADPALGAEHTRNLVATVGHTRELLRRTSDS